MFQYVHGVFPDKGAGAEAALTAAGQAVPGSGRGEHVAAGAEVSRREGQG